ncbi:MAG: cell division protein FtsB [Gammaproteobacteria bacterium]|jgi:cell division protein FtsB
MRILLAILVVALLVLQYHLWVGSGSMPAAWNLQKALNAQRHENADLKERNRALEAEVRDLKSGSEAIEERARTELGMIRPGETFYEIVEMPHDRKHAADTGTGDAPVPPRKPAADRAAAGTRPDTREHQP